MIRQDTEEGVEKQGTDEGVGRQGPRRDVIEAKRDGMAGAVGGGAV